MVGPQPEQGPVSSPRTFRLLASLGAIALLVGLGVWRLLSFRSPEAYAAVWEHFREDVPLILLLITIASAPLFLPNRLLGYLGGRGTKSVLTLLGLAFLAFQVVMIGHRRFSDYRFYNCAGG
jgi:hypothetical protein